MMSTGVLTLRRYQEEAIQATYAAWDKMRRPAVVLPTGAGKTVVFSHLAKQWREARTGQVVILVHRDELVRQTVAKLKSVAPMLKVGVVKGGENQIRADIIVASVQTLGKPARVFPLIGKVGLVIVDECHHATAASYKRVLEELGCFQAMDEPGHAVAVGFTATMSRADKAHLGEVWEEVVYSKDILDLIAMGHLCDVRGKLVTIDGMSLEEVKKSRGDFQVASLSDMLITSGAITAVADAYLEHAKGEAALLFAPTVEAAQLFTAALEERGVRAATVWGAMDEMARRRTLRRFDDGDLDVICNCMVLTEGFDSPRASTAIIARPTTSAALYIQMVGRVLRPHPSKTCALVLDVAGASRMHRLATLTDLSTDRVSDILEGESLAEAAERAVRDGALDLSGDVGAIDVELFHKSRSVWLQTPAGCWFIPTKEKIYFLWPEVGNTFKVGSRLASGQPGGRFLKEGLPMAEALAWTEQLAEEENPGDTVFQRGASWRSTKAPSEGQIEVAVRLGIDPAGMNRGRLSDAISIVKAGQMLDRAYTNLMAQRADQ
ncbi:DEAD/DEAH box helicase [Nonomuraea sp. NPDC050786]|uniref:DEAD/DEAH box helicase n=1 Tax=Nonomuraea sp. NPDC050786 TaxID=3154840 RepID=UPI0033E729A2